MHPPEGTAPQTEEARPGGLGRGGYWTLLTLRYLKEGYLQTAPGRLPSLPYPGLRPLAVQNVP